METTGTNRMLHIVGDLDRWIIRVRDPALRLVGIGREQWQVLQLLTDEQGHAMGEISDAVGLTGATATRVVDSLAQNMRVYRRTDLLDRRRTLIYIAEPGQELLRQVDEAMDENVATALGELERDERGHLVRLLERLVSTAATRSRPRQRSGKYNAASESVPE